MLLNHYPFENSTKLGFAGTPDGCDALLLGELAAAAGAPLLHIALDEARMAHLAETIGFFAPGVGVVVIPAWDCLPYDRVPPRPDVTAHRLAAFSHLKEVGDGPLVVLTTVSAALQRVPPRDVVAGAQFMAQVGGPVATEALTAFLVANGYVRAETVREPGEYAVRGGIIDIFPPDSEDALRLDLFGDELEGIRTFDPVSQRSHDRRTEIVLLAASEVVLDAPAAERFRTGYRKLFGAVRGTDLLYEAVSAGQRHPGMEHWLPLFYDRLETVFDYVGGPVTLDEQADDAVAARLELIADYHDARAAAKRARDRDSTDIVYQPLPPDRLYLSGAEFEAALAVRPVGRLSGFAAPPDTEDVIALDGRRLEDFAAARARPDLTLFDAVRERFAAEMRDGGRIIVAAYSVGSRARLAGLLRDHGVGEVAEAADWQAALAAARDAVTLVVLGLESGFAIGDLRVYTEQDILGDRLVRRPRRARRADDFITEVSMLSVGDLVVHVDHGVGRYDGLATLDIAGAPHDCLRVGYAGDDRLFLPVENLEMLTRFGAEDAEAQLDRLGGAGWQARKARVKERITAAAHELLRIAAQRQLREADRLTPPTGIYAEFAARFPFQETEDQARAIDDAIGDLGAGRPMDRLVCGDVGFGKTEVALRAAFVTALAGRQVAVVVPTTLLARQHFQTFCDRFAGLPVRIEQLSRLVTGKRATAVRDGLADGQVDIVIGTHALLAKSIAFRDLALLVVDEEQHFGVAQKERLKAFRAEVHVLTLTATPIPRTLQLALTGVREMSLIATPPVDRLAVRTFVQPYDPGDGARGHHARAVSRRADLLRVSAHRGSGAARRAAGDTGARSAHRHRARAHAGAPA